MGIVVPVLYGSPAISRAQNVCSSLLPGSVMQLDDLQSSGVSQRSPSSHASHSLPPQSGAASSPSSSPFEHDVHKPEVHCWLAQSAPTMHLCAGRSSEALAHKIPTARHTSPPQFLSVSWLSWILLLHCSAGVSVRHLNDVALHCPVTQSASVRQRDPIPHLCVQLPPQSRSDSLPSCTPFEQLTQTRPLSPV